MFRDLLAAGANDYLVKPPSRESLASVREKRNAGGGGGVGGLGQVIAFIGSRGGVGTTTNAVSCAWLLAEQHKQRTALVDLDLHFSGRLRSISTPIRAAGCARRWNSRRVSTACLSNARW